MEKHSVYYDNLDEPRKIAEFDLLSEALGFLLKNYRADFSKADEILKEEDYITAKFFNIDGKPLTVSVEKNVEGHNQ